MLRHVSLTTVLLMLLVVSTGTAFGFEKKAHGKISEKAVTIYREINPGLSEKREKALLCFIDGSKDEDDISVQRIRNWHFYDPEKKLGRTWWHAERSNGVRFEKLVNKISNPKGIHLEKLYAIAGRAVHHIQDMSSPPHTVPVYHLGDPFDSYDTMSIAKTTLTPETLASATKEMTGTLPNIFNELLNEAAKETLRRINEKVTVRNVTIADNWSQFWLKAEQTGERCRKAPCKGFGCYGKIEFGSVEGPFTKEVYRNFYGRQIESAVADTLKVLMLLEKTEI